MLPEDLIDIIRQVIAVELGTPLGDLDDGRSFRQDLGIDSIAAVNIIFELEGRFRIDIDLREFVGIDTIAELRSLLNRMLLLRQAAS